MNLLRRKKITIEKREQELSNELSALSDKIAALEKQIESPPSNASPDEIQPESISSASDAIEQPVFEELTITKVGENKPAEPAPDLFNEDGVRKFNLPAAWTRLTQFLKGPQPQNTKFVSHLAKGSPQGLAPLRREKRMARQRFLLMFSALLLILWFIYSVYLGTR